MVFFSLLLRLLEGNDSGTTHIEGAFQISKEVDLGELWDMVRGILRQKGYLDISPTSHTLFSVTQRKINIADIRFKSPKNRLLCVCIGPNDEDIEFDDSIPIQEFLIYEDDDEELVTIAVLSKELKEMSVGRTVAGNKLKDEHVFTTAVRTFVSKNSLCFDLSSLKDMTIALRLNFTFSGNRSQKKQGLRDLVELVSKSAGEGIPTPIVAETVHKR